MLERMELGAGNNADWCDLVCRTHGAPTAFDQHMWVTGRRSPPMYPDAVTLRPDADVDTMLARIDASPGCSVKDSFASLDLSPYGFRVLFSAEWIHRPPAPAPAGPGLEWSVVRTAGDLRRWATAHGGGQTFRPSLLDEPAVAVLAAHDAGILVAGVVANRSPSVVGLSNLFIGETDAARAWAGAAAAVSAHFPGRPIVGYEHGEDLGLALGSGFVSTGPLRVWMKD